MVKRRRESSCDESEELENATHRKKVTSSIDLLESALNQESSDEDSSLEEEEEEHSGEEDPDEMDSQADEDSASEVMSDDSDEDEGNQPVHVEDVARYDWDSLVQSAPTRDDSTRRLAVLNFNWDKGDVADLFAIFYSFLPSGGKILSITRYPSQYGIEAMSRGDVYAQIASKSKSPSTEETTEEITEEDTEEAARHVSQMVRQHQLDRLRYYYAIVECDSIATAEQLYSDLDNYELERSGVRLDLRFVDDSMEFETDPNWSHLEQTLNLQSMENSEIMKDRLQKYADNYLHEKFAVATLCKTSVNLDTYDETPINRRKALKHVFQEVEKGQEFEESKLRDFLAMSDEDDEEEEDEGGDGDNDFLPPESTASAKQCTLSKQERIKLLQDVLRGKDLSSGGSQNNVFEKKKKLSKVEKSKEKLRSLLNLKDKLETAIRLDSRFDVIGTDPLFAFEPQRLKTDDLAKYYHEHLAKLH